MAVNKGMWGLRGASLPDRSGHAGEFLHTDGTTEDWKDVKEGSSGTTLPVNPEVGDDFRLTAQDGSNAPGFYLCLTAGSWTFQRVLTAAEVTKLAGIEAGAQVNPKRVVLFAAEDSNTKADGSSINDGEIGIFAGGSIVQVGQDIAESDTLFLPVNAAVYNQNTLLPGTNLSAVSTTSLLEDIIDNGGVLLLYVIPYTDSTKDLYVEAKTIVKVISSGDTIGYKLTNLTWHGSYIPASAGVSWNIAIDRDSLNFSKNIVDLQSRLNAYVERVQLEGHKNDLFGSYQEDFLQASITQRVSGFIFTTDTSGPPTEANRVAQIASVDDGTYCIAVSTVFYTNADAYQYPPDVSPAKVAADYPVGKVGYIHSQNPYITKAYLKYTITTAGVLVGTGNAAYIYFYATVDEVETFANGDYFRFSEIVPSDLKMALPASAIVNVPWLERDRLIGPTAPTGPEDGMLWVDTTERRLKQYIAKPTNDTDRYVDLTDISTSPHGFIAHGKDAWVIDRAANKGLHFLVPDAGPLIREESKDFSLDPYNNNPVGACTDGTRIWVGDNGRHKAFAYNLSDLSRNSSYDITFDSNNRNATSLGTDGSVVWVGDNSDGKAYAHTIGSGMPRNTGKDLTFSGGLDNPHGMALDGNELYIIDATDDIGYAHTLNNSVATADAGNNFDLVSGSTPVAADYDKGVIWITDNGSPKRINGYRAKGWHTVALGLGNALRILESVLEKRDVSPLPVYGTAFPSNPVKKQRLIVSKDASTDLTAALDTFDKTAETSSLATFTGDDIAWANLQNHNGVHIGTKTQAQRDLLNSLKNGDEVHFIDNETDATVLTLYLTGAASSYTFNSETIIVFPNSVYSNTISSNPFIDERSYTIVPVEDHPTRKDDVWEWTGLYWKKVNERWRPYLLATLTNLGTAWTNLGSPMEDSDIISVSVKGTISSNVNFDGDPLVVAAIDSSGGWIAIKGGNSGDRVNIRKQSGGQLQVQRAGTLTSVRVDLVKLN